MIRSTILVLIALTTSLFAAGETADTTHTYGQPALLTSAGQTADVLILKGLSLRAGIDVDYCPAATGDSLEGAAVVILVAGGSSKGLGAAKIDPEVEMKRVSGIVKAAAKRGVPVITFHIGGVARRGALSDPFNKLAAEAAEVVVVVTTGDEDGLFRKIAAKSGAQYISIDKQMDAIGVLKTLFADVSAEGEKKE